MLARWTQAPKWDDPRCARLAARRHRLADIIGDHGCFEGADGLSRGLACTHSRPVWLPNALKPAGHIFPFSSSMPGRPPSVPKPPGQDRRGREVHAGQLDRQLAAALLILARPPPPKSVWESAILSDKLVHGVTSKRCGSPVLALLATCKFHPPGLGQPVGVSSTLTIHSRGISLLFRESPSGDGAGLHSGACAVQRRQG